MPVQFRPDLGETYILAKWYEGCLVLVELKAWRALWQRLTGGEARVVSQIRETERFILASAYSVKPDEQGRIVIPEELVTFAGLGEEVAFLGVGDRVEIWDKGRWEGKEKVLREEAAKLIDDLANERP